MTSISGGGVILCKQSISTFQYFKFVIGVIKREKIDIVHFHFGSYLIAPFLRILFPRIRICKYESGLIRFFNGKIITCNGFFVFFTCALPSGPRSPGPDGGGSPARR